MNSVSLALTLSRSMAVEVAGVLATCCLLVHTLFLLQCDLCLRIFFAPPLTVYVYRYTFTFCSTLAPAPPTFPPSTHRIPSVFCL